MVILKIPIVYLCGVVYYAIKATPKPEAGAAVTARVGPDPGPEQGRRRRGVPARPRPHGGAPRPVPAHPPRGPRQGGAPMSSLDVPQSRPSETIAGFLAAMSIFICLIG